MLVEGTDWLYAVGDVNGRALLTHQSKYQARAAGEAIAARLHGDPREDAPWGWHVAELGRAATIAIVGEVTIERLWHAVPAYPTISEVWLRLLESDR